MTASLVFDDTIEICDPDGHVSDADYWFETLADGASFGDPQPVEVVVASLIRYGAIVATTGDENREPTFLIRVCGADSGSLNEGIQALHAATRKQTTLVWTSPDGYSEPLAWEVQTSHLLEADGFDDLALVRRNQQVFRLQIKALPYRRGTTLIVDDAGTPPSTGGTVLYDCESTTGWATYLGGETGSYAVDSGIFTEGAGSLRSQTLTGIGHVGNNDFAGYHYSYANVFDQVTGLSLDTDTGGYLSIAIRTEWSDNIPGISGTTGLTTLLMQVGGAWVEVAYTAISLDEEGFVHYVWPVDADLTVTGLRMRVDQFRVGDYTTRPYVWYDDVELLPSATTDHQIVKQLTVQGSAPTPASIRVSSPNEAIALDNVLIATVPTNQVPDGFQPDGERWLNQGYAFDDATAISGHYYAPHATDYDDGDDGAGHDYPVFDVPATMLTTGSYTMIALLKAETLTPTFGVQAQTRVDGAMVGPTSTAEITASLAETGWQFVVVGTAELPPLPVQGASSTTKVRLLFKGAKFANIYFIPAWTYNGWPVADFSIARCGDGVAEPGGPSSSLWLDSPSVTNEGLGTYWRGSSQDRSDAQSAFPDMTFPGVHMFQPGGLTAFVVSTGVGGPTLRLEYFDRYL